MARLGKCDLVRLTQEPILDIVLEPNRPLATRWLLAIVAAVGFISFVAGIMFVLHGAWPVTPFLGADVVLLACLSCRETPCASPRNSVIDACMFNS